MEQDDEAASPQGLVRLQSSIDPAKSMNWNSLYKLVKRIPRGQVATYGQIARVLRLRGGARSAGRAMAACPSGHGIPWHRVVGAGGYLRIPEPHGSLQRRLLEAEAVTIDGTKVDIARHGWSPKRYGQMHRGKVRADASRGKRKE